MEWQLCYTRYVFVNGHHEQNRMDITAYVLKNANLSTLLKLIKPLIALETISINPLANVSGTQTYRLPRSLQMKFEIAPHLLNLIRLVHHSNGLDSVCRLPLLAPVAAFEDLFVGEIVLVGEVVDNPFV